MAFCRLVLVIFELVFPVRMGYKDVDVGFLAVFDSLDNWSISDLTHLARDKTVALSIMLSYLLDSSKVPLPERKPAPIISTLSSASRPGEPSLSAKFIEQPGDCSLSQS